MSRSISLSLGALRVATLVFAFVAPPLLAGFVTLYARTRDTAALDPVAAAPATLPPRPPASDATGRRLAVIVAGNRGTEITDSLPLVELLAESGAFEVRIVAPRRVASPFRSAAVGTAGLDFVPDLSFAEYDELVGRPPDLVIVPYLSAWRHEDADVVPWIRAHVGAETMLLSICQGAEIVAATGLFDGHSATGHYRGLDELAAQHPQIRYRRDVRWVRDRNRMSSGSLTAGLDATLAAIDTLAGRAAALRAARAVSYLHTRFLDDPAAALSRDRLGLILEMAYRWERTKVGVVIEESASESAIAALLDMYAATLTADSVAIAARPGVVATRHGVRLLPHGTAAHLSEYDHIAFANELPTAVASYDAALAAIADTHGTSMARAVARAMNYPAQDLGLDGGSPVGVTMVPRIALLGLLGVFAWFAITVMRRKGARRSGMKTLLPALLATTAAACGGRASPVCSADPEPEKSAILLDILLEARAGQEPFAMGKMLTSATGDTFSVSTLRFYLSHLQLVNDRGETVPAVLAEADGTPTEYGVALVDYAQPASTTLHVLVPPGQYRSLALSIGVPENCADGGALNHENALEQNAPLDVDTDMYWGWDPGYIFLKIEGHVSTSSGSKSFLFHVGDDERYVTASMPASFDVAGPATHRIAVDVNRFFVAPDGSLTPDPRGITTSNKSHGGREADLLANNLANSEVFQWLE